MTTISDTVKYLKVIKKSVKKTVTNTADVKFIAIVAKGSQINGN